MRKETKVRGRRERGDEDIKRRWLGDMRRRKIDEERRGQGLADEGRGAKKLRPVLLKSKIKAEYTRGYREMGWACDGIQIVGVTFSHIFFQWNMR